MSNYVVLPDSLTWYGGMAENRAASKSGNPLRPGSEIANRQRDTKKQEKRHKDPAIDRYEKRPESDDHGRVQRTLISAHSRKTTAKKKNEPVTAKTRERTQRKDEESKAPRQ